MRKLLASLLAAAMVASIGATISFAATPATTTSFAIDTAVSPNSETIYDEVIMTVDADAGGAIAAVAFSESINLVLPTSSSAAAIAKKLDGTKIRNVELGGKYYTATIKQVAATGTVVVMFDPSTVTGMTLASTVKLQLHKQGAAAGTNVDLVSTGTASTFASVGDANPTADLEISDNLNIEDAILCDGNNNPIALTEDVNVVGGDQNNDEGIQGARTLYFMVKEGAYKFDDDTFWKLKITKGDNAKIIKEVSDVTKNFAGGLVGVGTNGRKVYEETKGRHRYVKVKLNDIYTDDEYKLTLDMRLTPKSKAVNVFTNVTDDMSIKINDFSFWIKNLVKSADNDWRVGLNGLMLSPAENDWNNVTWYDEDGDLAHLKFFADSDSDKFYSKLSTKWGNEFYAAYFADQDAYRFEFTGSPTLSATSRADLEIYNPFVNEDGDETIDPATAIIYQVVGDELIPVTDSFTYEEGDNGDMAYKTRTRLLGTYVICEKEIEEASDAEAPDEIAPDEMNPDEMVPDAGKDNGGKAPANTGKFI